MKAILNNIIIKPFYEEIKTEEGIISEKSEKHHFSKGKVISKGELVDNLNEGDIAWYNKHRANNIKIKGENFDIMNINNIFVVE